MRTSTAILILLQIVLYIFSVISTGSDESAALDRIHQALSESPNEPSQSNNGAALDRIHQALPESHDTAISSMNAQENDLKCKSVDALTIENVGSISDPISVKMSDTYNLRYVITAHTDGGDICGTYIQGTYGSDKPYTIFARLGIYSTIDGHLVHRDEKEIRSNTRANLGYISNQEETIPIYIDPNVYNEGIYHNQWVYDPAVYKVDLEIYAAKMKFDQPSTPLGSLSKGDLIGQIGHEVGYFKVDTDEGICIDRGGAYLNGQCLNKEVACQQTGGTYKNGKCYCCGSDCLKGSICDKQPQQTPEEACKAEGNKYYHGQCMTPEQYAEMRSQEAEEKIQELEQSCEAQGGTLQRDGTCKTE